MSSCCNLWGAGRCPARALKERRWGHREPSQPRPARGPQTSLESARTHLAPLCVKGVVIPAWRVCAGHPRRQAQVALMAAAVRRELGAAGATGRMGRVPGAGSQVAGPGSDLSEAPAMRSEPAALEPVAAPRCPPASVRPARASALICRNTTSESRRLRHRVASIGVSRRRPCGRSRRGPCWRGGTGPRPRCAGPG
jgi:hypothetical protein